MGKESCIYCQKNKATSRDHVISKGLFPDNYKIKNPITVPACQDCNQGFSLNEEYFRTFLSNFHENSPEAKSLFDSKVTRSLKRSPKLVNKIAERMELVHAYTKEKEYIGIKTKISITPEDWERHFKVLDKYVKGLFYHEFKQPLPPDYQIRHKWGDKEKFHKAFAPNILKWNRDNEKILLYGYNYVPETMQSIWSLVFFNTICFQSFALKFEDFKRIDKTKN